MLCYSQHVRDDSYTPHVCGKGDKIVIDHFRGQEFWCAEVNLELLPWSVPAKTNVCKMLYKDRPEEKSVSLGEDVDLCQAVQNYENRTRSQSTVLDLKRICNRYKVRVCHRELQAPL